MRWDNAEYWPRAGRDRLFKLKCLQLYVRGCVVQSVLEKPCARSLSCFLGPPLVSPIDVQEAKLWCRQVSHRTPLQHIIIALGAIE